MTDETKPEVKTVVINGVEYEMRPLTIEEVEKLASETLNNGKVGEA